ncbi:MAG: PaaI family thioesterase [Flavobacteriales bacterium]|nr:PaaI family thioesterase [Flavobacteriales bacterium]MBL0044759.1 PaaI family thioesterase [Flavobacteriales bacterium]
MLTTEQIAIGNTFFKGTLMETLGIELVQSAPGTVAATMAVEARTHQPMGSLHGGATVALAESLGSTCSYLLVDAEKQAVVGIEVNANHIKSVRSGMVKATGRLLHKGRATHVWDIQVTNDKNELVAVCRLTNLIIDRKP